MWEAGRTKTPIRVWAREVEEGAMEQAVNCANHPCVEHVALMPDVHQGYGMPVGGVIAVKDAIIPNAVGVDIGCGMCAVRTPIPVKNVDKIAVEEILDIAKGLIPTGFSSHDEPAPRGALIFKTAPQCISEEEINRSRFQLGTLGGGNHFIELQRGSDGYLWAMIHSGSRKLGFNIANHYHEAARILCEKWHVDLPHKDLAFLPTGIGAEGSEYKAAMQYAQRWALVNRETMMKLLLQCIDKVIQGYDFYRDSHWININHNFATLEMHFGKNYWIHRKGATSARLNEEGIIPGSMGTNSYIVKGRGNPLSMTSCSHGAGRRMGRMAFRRETTEEEANKSIEHVVFAGWGKDRAGNPDYSEAPDAYKDIQTVMSQQQDLVDVVVELTPLGVLKG